MTPLLRVEDLRVSFPGVSGHIDAVRGISFDLGREKLGLGRRVGFRKIDRRASAAAPRA